MDVEYNYDYFVIGGGSGGLASAKEAANLGAKVALADYVKPSPIGTTWGLGGTCVNVGCIPKKLMHYASILGELKRDQKASGWQIDEVAKHDWKTMVAGVQSHIASLNWGYKGQLMEKKVKYFNRLASMVDAHTVELYDPKKNTRDRVTAKYILVAVGGRPSFPDNIPNAKEDSITSDDLFSLKANPGKTLIVGASYVSLECAGFLRGVGNEVCVMVRSILLRGFDQEMAERIGTYMEEGGIRFLRKCVPEAIEKLPNGRKKVTWRNIEENAEYSEEFDTIMFAIGRTADTSQINLEKIGVLLDKTSKKIIVNEAERTNIENIFALGDCAKGRPELTPTAIMAGKFLAQRLFDGSKQNMNYKYVATAVFTPIEYGSCGYSEEDAFDTFGRENIDVYHSSFKPLEWNFSDERAGKKCYIKMIVDKGSSRVMGIHYLGPNAGEVIQGYAVALKLGAKKEDFDNTVGIHPTCSEEMLGVTVKKGEGDAEKSGC